ncbi:hypothetical protein pipiens_008952 [Culex pipiens pipiens]|uniref:Uncharacterized protein n=1 Tax=Culex pipiens pipiens TaxID=38569 RepID=A0ABD1DFI7_CULPP
MSKHLKNDHIYESIRNLKCCNLQAAAKSNLQSPAMTIALNNSATSTTLICQDCTLERCLLDETLPLGGDLGHSGGNLGCGSRNGSGHQSSETQARKLLENSPKHRHRSHTISACVNGDQEQQCTMIGADQTHVVAAHNETNLCGYDSYLHQTICAAAASAKHATLHGGQHDAHTQRKEQRLAVTNRTQQYPNLYSTSNIRICQLAEEMVEREGPRKAAALKLKRSKSKERSSREQLNSTTCWPQISYWISSKSQKTSPI